MVAPNTRNILKIPGRLVKDPTDLTAAYPHGGTELGIARDCRWSPGIKAEKIVPEEYKTPIAAIVTDEEAVMALVLRTQDKDMIQAAFPNTQLSADNDAGILGKVAGSGHNRAGFDLATKGFKLLFSPQAVDRHPHVLFYNAVPLLDETVELQLSIAEEFGIPLMFLAMPDARGWTYAADLRDNITL